MSLESDSWSRYFRDHHPNPKLRSRENLAKAAGISKIFLSKIERGERNPSPRTARAIAEKLDEPVEDVFPTDGRKSPDEAATLYLEFRRARAEVEPPAIDPEFESFCRRNGLDPEEEAGPWDGVRFEGEDRVVIDFSVLRKTRPSSTKSSSTGRSESRARQPHTRTRRTTKTSSSSDDDPPGEPGPERGPPELTDFAGLSTAKELERAGTVVGAAPSAARSRGRS